ncbi:MAG: NACHT domain-containing protein [Henriciella sp.]|nr:NACHT domain-containing protein [Henriciella sp.]
MKNNAVDGMVNLTLGVGFSIACLPAGAAAVSSAAIAGAIGAANLISLVFEHLEKSKVIKRTQLKQIKSDLRSAIDNEWETHSFDNIKTANAAKDFFLANYESLQLGRTSIAESFVNSNDFPEVAARLVLSGISSDELEGFSKKRYVEASDIENILLSVLSESFLALSRRSDFIQAITPELQVAIAHAIGKQVDKLNNIDSAIKTSNQKLDKLLTAIREFEDNIELKFNDLQSADLSALNEDLSSYETEIRRLKNTSRSVRLSYSDKLRESGEEPPQSTELKVTETLIRKNVAKKKQIENRIAEIANSELRCSVLCRWIDIPDSFEQSMSRLTPKIHVWADTVNFRDARREQQVSKIYVDLDAMVTPANTHMEDTEQEKTIPIQDILISQEKHLVILGGPGAGKTTSMKKFCNSFYKRSRKENFERAPILIRVRELHVDSIHSSFIQEKVLSELGVIVQFDSYDLSGEHKASILEDLYGEVARIFRPLVIIDGFDECKDDRSKQALLDSFRRACRVADPDQGAFHVLTCRTGEFSYSLEGVRVFQLAPLNQEQIDLFARRWLGRQRASEFTKQLLDTTFADNSLRPLFLAHLCELFERLDKVPDRPSLVYSKVVGLLVEDWDSQRSVKRAHLHDHFRGEQKQKFLGQLGYLLTTKINSEVFSAQTLRECYQSMAPDFNLPIDASITIASELEAHTGLFVRSGYDKFEFSHKSLQEYLAAQHVVGLPRIPSEKKILRRLATELAIAVSISTSPNDYFVELALEVFPKIEPSSLFMNAFLSRLILEKPILNRSQMTTLAIMALASSYGGSDSGDKKKKNREDEQQKLRMVIELLNGRETDFLIKYYEFQYSANSLSIKCKLRDNVGRNQRLPRWVNLSREALEFFTKH